MLSKSEKEYFKYFEMLVKKYENDLDTNVS
jgi:hypothetical protein